MFRWISRILCFLFTLSIFVAFFSGNGWADSGVTADPLQLDFGEQAAGTLGTPQTLVLTNASGVDRLFGDIFISGTDPQQFQIVTDLCSGLTLVDGASCSLSILFAPNTDFLGGVGSADADLLVPFEGTTSLTVPLQGVSLVPQISVSAVSLNFGQEVAGRLSDSQTVTITNTGESDLMIADNKVIGLAPQDFGLTMDFCSFQTLAPGETCQIAMSMRATEIGVRTAQFVIENNDPAQPFLTIELSGEGKGSGGCQMITRGLTPVGGGFWLFFGALLISIGAA